MKKFIYFLIHPVSNDRDPLTNLLAALLAIFLVLGVGRYILNSTLLSFEILKDREYISATFSEYHPQKDLAHKEFASFLNTLSLRKFSNYSLTWQWAFEGLDNKSEEKAEKVLNKLEINSPAYNFTKGLQKSYGTCCKPYDRDNMEITAKTLKPWAKHISKNVKNGTSSNNEIQTFLLILRDTALGELERPLLDGHWSLSLFFYLGGQQGIYGRGKLISDNNAWRALNEFGKALTVPVADIIAHHPSKQVKIDYAAYASFLKFHTEEPELNYKYWGYSLKKAEELMQQRLPITCTNKGRLASQYIAEYFLNHSTKENPVHRRVYKKTFINVLKNNQDKCIKAGFNVNYAEMTWDKS
ncbi:MAG: hypothetical protein VX730_02000 [Pseudomonadota bacterium]|nr:hypothetical protein [Pseudomonadota bacterium]